MSCDKCGVKEAATGTSREIKRIGHEFKKYDVIRCLVCFNVLKITEV